ncbi:hypothetical protein SYNTR_0251 [Candidatus Syntrophocurvum alkaliphilum]|uniref:Uncharacterized protein n=1 Tax=Candidatus Syntrophocurvum alkaliphilum TaxID=2293317 RepID=A0A6I6DBK5_9FIRM|nr:hypothetical protein [Candidatus Syntrophocurvum alkaliphilum]QGT98844.1 hypothetical protein SYNTR_0251 [Candidatus Syntrophocurvum alkaliphilum]
MDKILAEFQHSLQSDNLFEIWEKELDIRLKLRNSNIQPNNIVIENEETIELLKRSLYYSHKKEIFYKILYNNMNNLITVKWLQKTPFIIKEFLEFIPYHIIKTNPQGKDLNFLINIYQDKYLSSFTKIVNVLDINNCTYLLSRTGNQNFKNLLKERESYIINQSKSNHYGLLELNDLPIFEDTPFGKKSELVSSAINLVTSSSVSNFQDPYGPERVNTLLNACDNIFMVGLIEDSLATLLELYEDFSNKNRLVNLIDEETVYKNMNKLLRKVVPTYTLLASSTSPYNNAQMIYKKLFEKFSPDPASLHYLLIYERVRTNLYEINKFASYEFLEIINKIYSYRPHDDFVELYNIYINEPNNNILFQLKNIGEQRIYSLPNEAFVIFELLRLIIQQENISDPYLASSLLKNYYQLWKWIPCNLFLHKEILDQLAIQDDDNLRKETEFLVSNMKNMNDLFSEFKLKPKLFLKKDANAKLELVLAKLMGAI